MNEEIPLNEKLFMEGPTIAGATVRAYSNSVKLKLGRIMRWIGDHEDQAKNEEILFAFAYLIAAPIERVALNTGNKLAYLIDKEKFIAELTEDEIKKCSEWFVHVMNLEKETEIEVAPKPGASGDNPPPN